MTAKQLALHLDHAALCIVEMQDDTAVFLPASVAVRATREPASLARMG